MKCIDYMSIEELENEIEILRNEEYKHEWQYEFTRQEIKQIRRMIQERKNAE